MIKRFKKKKTSFFRSFLKMSTLKNDKERDDVELSDYMKRRAENIIRNNAVLRGLGLISTLEEQRSNSGALGKSLENEIPKKRRKLKDDNVHKNLPTRKSRRLLGEDADGQKIEDIEVKVKRERQDIVKECREVRLRAAKAVAEAGAEKAARENPTATYEHCLMRVRTMTEKGLLNRVKAIERAAGKHCVVKMAIFKSCLQDEDLWDLAKVASDALERLKSLKPPPE